MSEVYVNLMESLALWFQSRGSARRDAVLRAGVAFSMCGLAIILSMMMLFTALGGVPLADLIAGHGWSIWAVTAVVALIHWPLVLKLRRRNWNAQNLKESPRRSRYLWCWYCVPVFALFIVSSMIAIASSN